MGKYSKKQYLIAGAAAIAIAGAAGGAYAYWTDSGTGSGTDTTGTSTPWTVNVTSPTTNDLSPAGPTDTINFSVTNAGSGNQQLNSTTASVTGTSNSGCTSADFAVSATTLTTGNYGTILPNAGVTGSFTLQMKDTGVNQNACKGVTVNLQVAAA